jgi:hypothetical protein
MQFSELIEVICGLIGGPTEILEDCDQAQATLKRMREKEEDISQGKLLWQIDKLIRSTIESLCKER